MHSLWILITYPQEVCWLKDLLIAWTGSNHVPRLHLATSSMCWVRISQVLLYIQVSGSLVIIVSNNRCCTPKTSSLAIKLKFCISKNYLFAELANLFVLWTLQGPGGVLFCKTAAIPLITDPTTTRRYVDVELSCAIPCMFTNISIFYKVETASPGM